MIGKSRKVGRDLKEEKKIWPRTRFVDLVTEETDRVKNRVSWSEITAFLGGWKSGKCLSCG